MKDFPFYTQETNYTCGAAAMRTALEFCGIRKSEKQVEKLLGTNKVRGTWHKDFSKLAERYKLTHITKRNAFLHDLRFYRKRGYIVIVCYMDLVGNVDHYSIVKKLGSKFIHLWDPFFEESYRYPISDFNKVWHSNPKYENENKWFFAVKNTAL